MGQGRLGADDAPRQRRVERQLQPIAEDCLVLSGVTGRERDRRRRGEHLPPGEILEEWREGLERHAVRTRCIVLFRRYGQPKASPALPADLSALVCNILT